MSHKRRFRDTLFTELSFGTSHLQPLRKLYQELRSSRIDRSLSFDVLEGLDKNMFWYYAANQKTLDQFGTCLRRSNLKRSLDIVDGRPELIAACFIVVTKGISPCGYHIDYGEEEIPEGVSATLLTPLYEFAPQFGHMEYLNGTTQAEYRYRLGRAILFDGKLEHRSQPFEYDGDKERVLVSLSIASTRPRYRAAIRRVIDSQTKSQ